MARKKVVVAMSGGVDSSVTAAILQRKGYEVTGVMMEIYDQSLQNIKNGCHACFGPGEIEDIEDAQRISKKLAIPLHVIDLKNEYREKILDFFTHEYLKGRTPNPCIKCNREMKFGAIIRELSKMGVGYDYFATGHYARVGYYLPMNVYCIRKALDLTKDQSYFLYHLGRDLLEKLIFPLGIYKKEEVRTIAKGIGLDVFEKPESQDFIEGGYHQLFKQPENPGPIIDTEGKEIGKHKGLIFYTVGQRRGIGISNPKPLYVISKDSERNTIVVGTKEYLLGTGLIAKEVNWLVIETLDWDMNVKARIRYNHKEADAELSPVGNGKVKVRFREPQMAISPGQSVVFYDRDIVMGGGIIEKEIKDELG